MDWMNLEADTTQIIPCHYTAGRGGYSIDKVVIHYNAGDLSVEGCYSVWSNREASAHYQVESSGRIGQLVNDWDTAWHAGDWAANCSSIGIEHANKEGGYVTDECLDAGAHLVAAVCRTYGLGRPEWCVNVFPHSYFAPTQCLPVKTTELLTRNGWVKLSDISVGDEVATARFDDLHIEFSPVRSIVEPYKTNCWLSNDIEATADHRMLVRAQNQKLRSIIPWKSVCGCTSKKATKQYYIPNAGYASGNGLDVTDTELQLIVAVQADGHYSKDHRSSDPNRVNNVRFHLKKDRKIENLVNLLDDSGYKYSLHIKKDGTTDIIVNRDLYVFCEDYLDDKVFTWKMLDMNKHQRKIFADALLDWDGCREGKYYSSSVRQNLDVVQAILCTSGIGTRFGSDDKTVRYGASERTVNNGSAKRTYDRKVSCITVDTGLILIRQNRRTAIVGNCPGRLQDDQRDAYMSRAQQWYDNMVDGADAPSGGIEWTPSQPSGPSYSESDDFSSVPVHYALHVEGGDWLPTVTDFNNSDGDGFAGIPCCKHDMLIAWVEEGDLSYQVHTMNNGWLDMVDHADWNDDQGGMAGIWGDTIDGVRMYYTTPNGVVMKCVWYRSQTTRRNGYLEEVCDDGTSWYGGDDFAGILGEPLDRLQVCVSNKDPF